MKNPTACSISWAYTHHVAELDLRNIMVVDSTHLETIILPASSDQSIVHSGKDSESVCLEVGLRE